MDSFNMTNRAQNMNHIRKLHKGFFYHSSQGLQIWGYIRGKKVGNKVKFQLKISKMIAATTKNTGTCGVNATLGPFHKEDTVKIEILET